MHTYAVRKEIPLLSVRLIKDQFHCLNLETNSKELRKYSRSLKKRQSPGLDRMFNEMIKSSFEVLKSKKKVNRNELLCLDGKVLINVAQFVYLGLKIDAK